MGMIASLAAGACGKERDEGARKLRVCSTAITSGKLFDFSENERSKRAFLHLERGIALLQLDRIDAARQAFERAMRDGALRNGAERFGRQHARLVALGNGEALELWKSIALGSDTATASD